MKIIRRFSIPALLFLAFSFTAFSKIYIAPFKTAATSKPVVALPAKEDDLDALFNKAAQASVELKQAADEKEELRTKVVTWRKRLDTHNANQCTYPPEHPEACNAYAQEKVDLENERDVLKAAVDENAAQTGILKSRFGMLKARIRITALLRYQCDCAGLEPEAASECQSRCFDGKDPRLKSCLDIDGLAFRACLDNVRRAKNRQ